MLRCTASQQWGSLLRNPIIFAHYWKWQERLVWQRSYLMSSRYVPVIKGESNLNIGWAELVLPQNPRPCEGWSEICLCRKWLAVVLRKLSPYHRDKHWKGLFSVNWKSAFFNHVLNGFIYWVDCILLAILVAERLVWTFLVVFKPV